jgi:hypothetical protein
VDSVCEVIVPEVKFGTTGTAIAGDINPAAMSRAGVICLI